MVLFGMPIAKCGVAFAEQMVFRRTRLANLDHEKPKHPHSGSLNAPCIKLVAAIGKGD